MIELALRTLVLNLDLAILLEDPRRRVRHANEAFCRMFGIPARPEALVGADCAAAAIASAPMFDDPRGFLSRIDEVLAERRVAVDLVVLRDGRTWERKYLPITEAGAPGGHFWVYRDVTAERAALADAEGRARSATDLLHEVAFGLRAQLHSVVGLADVCAEGRTLEEIRSATGPLQRSAHALRWTLEATLDASPDEAFPPTLPFDPTAAAEEVLLALSATGRDRGVELVLVVEPSVPDVVEGAPQRLRHILTNLVAGLLDAPASDGERLVVRLSLDDALTIAVHRWGRARLDRPERPRAGVGVAIATELARRSGGSLTAEAGNRFTVRLPVRAAPAVPPGPPAVEALRVGLIGPDDARTEAAARALDRLGVELVRPAGDADPATLGPVDVLVVTAVPHDPPAVPSRRAPGAPAPVLRIGEGPLAHPLTRPALAEALDHALGLVRPTPPPLTPLAPERVLVVEDSPANAAVLEAKLRRAGHTARVAPDGASGFGAFREGPWALVLLDLDLPDETGQQVARRMRAWEAETGRPRTPIVACTAQVTDAARAECRAAGMDGFLGKPLHRDALREELRRWLRSDRTVLVVDDAPHTHLLYAHWLAKLGLAARHASDGISALEALAREPAELVLLDVEMPGLDGIETVRRLRDQPGGAGVRVIVATGHTDAETHRRALAAGADAVLVKPIAREAFAEMVHRLLSQPAPRSQRAAPPAPDAPRLDPDILELLPDYLVECRAEVATIRAALASGAHAPLARSAHRLKGSGASYGFPRISELAAALEVGPADPATVDALELFLDQVEAALRARAPQG